MIDQDTKLCYYCKQQLPLPAFNKHSGNKDGLANWCRECWKKYYYRNKEKLCKQAQNRNRENKRLRLQFSLSYLKSKGCIDCGETDPIVLEFDHVRGTKFKDVSLMVKKNFSMEKIKAEIDKCDVRCANCHRRKTAEQFGWYKDIDLSTL